MFPNQRQSGQVPGAKNAQTKPNKLKKKAAARPKRPPSGLAGVQLYGGGQPPMMGGGMRPGMTPGY